MNIEFNEVEKNPSNDKIKRTMNGRMIKQSKNDLYDALPFDVYSYQFKNDRFQEIVSWAFSLFKQVVKLTKSTTTTYKRYSDCVRYTIFNAYIGYCVNKPIRCSKSADSFRSNGQYGQLWFTRDIFCKTFNTLIKLDLIDGINGEKDPEYEHGLQTRFQASQHLIKKFEEILSEQIAERLPKERLIILKDKNKNKIKLDNMDMNKFELSESEYNKMISSLERYNEFAKQQVVTLPLDHVKITHDFLTKMNIQFRKGMIDIYSSSEEYSFNNNYNLYNTNSYNYINITSNNNNTIVNTIPLLGRNLKKQDHQSIPSNKRKSKKFVRLSGKLIHIKYLYLHRVFNNSSLLLGGRSYGTLIQSLPNNPKRSKRLSKLRNRLLINGNETVELDFGSLHPSLLYNKYLGIDINGDLYNGFEDRSKAKYTLLTLLNCCDTDKINYTKSIDAIRKKLIDEGYRSEDGLTNVEIIKAIKFNELKHPNLVKQFGSGISLELMRIDSNIAMDILLNLMEKNIFAVPVHDSFIVERRYEKILHDQMISSYKKYTGHIPRIDKK